MSTQHSDISVVARCCTKQSYKLYFLKICKISSHISYSVEVPKHHMKNTGFFLDCRKVLVREHDQNCLWVIRHWKQLRRLLYLQTLQRTCTILNAMMRIGRISWRILRNH